MCDQVTLTPVTASSRWSMTITVLTKVSISGSQDSESFKGSKMNTLQERKDIKLDVSLGLKSKQTLNRA